MRLIVLINVMNTETIVCADCTVMFTATLQNHEIVKGILENQGFIKESIFIHRT